MTELSELEQKLADMASDLIEKAKDSKPEDKVDVFKAVSTWHIAMKKATKGEESDGGKFSEMRKTLREVK